MHISNFKLYNKAYVIKKDFKTDSNIIKNVDNLNNVSNTNHNTEKNQILNTLAKLWGLMEDHASANKDFVKCKTLINDFLKAFTSCTLNSNPDTGKEVSLLREIKNENERLLEKLPTEQKYIAKKAGSLINKLFDNYSSIYSHQHIKDLY